MGEGNLGSVPTWSFCLLFHRDASLTTNSAPPPSILDLSLRLLAQPQLGEKGMHRVTVRVFKGKKQVDIREVRSSPLL